MYPYQLHDEPPRQPDDAWAADITFSRMPIGFLYLVAIIDWYSRHVLACELSNTLDGLLLGRPETALQHQQPPRIFNTDQCCQFASEAFTTRLLAADVAINMDARGRVSDNTFDERLWRCVKYECIYLHEFADALSLRRDLGVSRLFQLPPAQPRAGGSDAGRGSRCRIMTNAHNNTELELQF